MDRQNICAACIREQNGVKSRVAPKHTCGKFPRKVTYSGGKLVKHDTPEPLTDTQKNRVAQLWMAAIIDSAGFPVFGDAVTNQDANDIFRYIKDFVRSISAPGSRVTGEAGTIIRYVKRYIK